MATRDTEVVRLFWTGGWDSTFRLLQLLVVEECIVQPYYVIDPGRKSTSSELRAMERIKALVHSEWPEARDRLRLTNVVDLAEIADDKEISAGFQRLRKKTFVGAQYEWLARLARSHGENSIELCLMREEGRMLDGALIKYEPDERGYRLSRDLADTDVGVVFRYFRYPVAHLSKRDMAAIASESGFRDALKLTWFCFQPRRDGRPCGCCRTCRAVVRSKLGERIPLSSQLRYHLSIKPRLREFVLRHDRMYLLGTKIKQLRRKGHRWSYSCDDITEH